MRRSSLTSLGLHLSQKILSKVPCNVLKQCKPEDAQIVDNILQLCAHTIHSADVSSCSIQVAENTYTVSIPLTELGISYSDLRMLHEYNPSRIRSIHIKSKSNTLNDFVLELEIIDNTCPIQCVEAEVVRVRKRSRWNWRAIL